MSLRSIVMIAVVVMCLVHAYCVGELVKYLIYMTIGAVIAMIFVATTTYLSHKFLK